MKRILTALSLATVVILWPLYAFSQGGQAEAQQPAPNTQQGPGGEGKAREHHKPTAEHHQMMKAAYDKCMAEMQAMDARLDEKVAAMNAASGDQKVAAMEAVINELVAQRKEMRDKMALMHHHGMDMTGPAGKHGKMKAGCMMEGHHGGTGSDAPKSKPAQ